MTDNARPRRGAEPRRNGGTRRDAGPRRGAELWPGGGTRPGGVPRRPTGAAHGRAADLEQQFDGDSLYALRAAVAAHGSQAGLSDGRIRDLVLVVHELAANAVRHGAGHGRLRLWATPDEVQCEISDDSASSPGAAARWRIEPGHGLWLVHRVADGTSVQSGPSGTVAAVSFRLLVPGEPPP